MSNEELESQLSAMFDDELPAPQCELLARRLARDEGLRTRWGHYAAIGACIRGEPGVQLETTLATKVTAAIKQEATPSGVPASRRRKHVFLNSWTISLGGAATAAAVAAVAIFWMRSQAPGLVAQNSVPLSPVRNAVVQTAALTTTTVAPANLANSGSHPHQAREPDSYVVPAVAAQGPVLVPPTELANYIVAHSAYSGPLMRRNALSALVAGDSAVLPASAEPVSATVVTGK